MLTKKIIIPNKLGLHARAAAKVVHLTGRFSSEIFIAHGTQKANGKSIIDLMLLAANKDAEVELIVDGEDEAPALTALEDLINTRFGEAE